MSIHLLRQAISYALFLIAIAASLQLGFDLITKHTISFLFVSLTSAIVPAALLIRKTSIKEEEYSPTELLLAGALSWLLVSFLAALPFLLGTQFISPIDAWFESVSAFTTTGMTMLSDPCDLGMSLLFWRSLLQWLGGISFVLFFVLVIYFQGAEMFNLSFQLDQERGGFLFHNLVLKMLAAYLFLTLFEVVLLFLFGLNLTQSVLLALSNMSTGGFVSGSKSLESFETLPIIWIVFFFMVLASINMTCLIGSWLKGRNSFCRSSEVKFFFALLAGATGVVYLFLYFHQPGQEGFFQLKVALFHTASMLSTSGFYFEECSSFPSLVKGIFVFLMIIGPCTLSLGSGLKGYRFHTLLKWTYKGLWKSMRPKAVAVLRIGDDIVRWQGKESLVGLVILFIFTFVVGTLVLCLFGLDIQAAFSSSIAALTNSGIGFGGGLEGNFYSECSSSSKVILGLLMLIGRIELYGLFFFAITLLRRS
jgi:trk system potassium uptake protein TrkH